MILQNSVTLLVNDDAYISMLDAIGSAKSYILMESYIFNDDKAGRLFSDALLFAVKKGVNVYLIIDGIGTFNTASSFFEKMKAAGIYIFVYHPAVPWKKGFNLFRRNHRKILIVDGHTGFAGGVNIADEWLGEKWGGKGWHDIHARVQGPAVKDLEKLTLTLWHKHTKIKPVLNTVTCKPSGANSLVRVIASHDRKEKRAIRKAYLYAINKAENYIYIANAYFIPDFKVRQALIRAVKRGIDVRIMVSLHSDIFPVHLAGAALYGSLLKKGVRIFEWKKSVLHAKTAVIDDLWATVGSYNLDKRSMKMNLEANYNIADAKFATDLRTVFKQDQQLCKEIDLKEWNRRSIIEKAAERFFYLFRNFM